MPLRIAFDLDGVLADMESELVRQAVVVFGEAVTAHLGEASVPAEEGVAPGGAAGSDNVPTLTRLRLTHRQQRKLWRHVASIENFWEMLTELEPGVIGRLASIARERQWEVIFLTRRPATRGYTAQVQTQRWLESKGFRLPSVFVVQGSRGKIAAALGLDVVVDDRPENCLDVVVDSTARAVLVWRDQQMKVPEAAKRLGIGVVDTLDRCLDILVQMDTPAAREHPGVMNRVMRLLGLKEALPV